jgi:hypothetical protein
MYTVFLIFAVRPFFKIVSKDEKSWNPLSFKWLLIFYQTLISLFFKLFKRIFAK